MRFLERERSTLASFLPKLDDMLASTPLMDLERPGGPGIAAFRECGGPGLLVPAASGGCGAGALDAMRVQRAIGARSPSLAVATTMHHFSMASLVLLSEVSEGFEWMLMEGIARGGKLLASGFAEGRPGGGILSPTATATAAPGGVLVSGVKRPCSLARSMDLLTMSLLVPALDGTRQEMAVALIPAHSDGLTVSPFWGTFALAGAESDQVTIDNVFVPNDLVIRPDLAPGEQIDSVQTAGFLWFELLMAASYLGAASALVQRVLLDDRIDNSERIRLVVEVEGAMAAVENLARQVDDGRRDLDLLTESLFVRYAVQDAIARAVPHAVELLGGLNFISNDEVGYLAASVNGLCFHPPARARMVGPLARYLLGERLEIV
jgi:alkylation response protein AidB-like acyl-CoA dehydrogenase